MSNMLSFWIRGKFCLKGITIYTVGISMGISGGRGKGARFTAARWPRI
jgi:hypothetical protein